MPYYSAVILTPEGSRRRRRTSARDPEDARARLRAQGFFVERIVPSGRIRCFLKRTRISPVHQVLFYQQMQMLLSSGVLIADALQNLKDLFPDKRTKCVLAEVHSHVSESRTGLSQAMAQFPRSFPSGVIAVMEAGEKGGAALLAERFGDLAERIAFEEAHRRRIRRACAYPAFVVCLSVGLYVLLLGVVFPRLAALLGSLGSELPPLTRGVIAAADCVKTRWLPAAIFVPAGAALIASARRLPGLGRHIDRCFLEIPIIGTIYRESAIALICKIYRSLYLANQPAPIIVDLCAKLVDNKAVRHELDSVRRRIAEEGSTLSSALAGTNLFPPLACLAIEVGEQTGQIASALDRTSGYFSARARERLDSAIAVINPALTLLVVGGAGLILISFFQASYQIVYATR